MNHSIRPSKRSALITGSAKRVGAAITKQLHQAQFDVIIGCHQSTLEATELANTLNTQRPGSARVLVIDLTKDDLRESLIAELMVSTPGLCVLINNASLFIKDDLNQPLQSFQRLFNIHVKAPYALSLQLAPVLCKNNGCIINISDIHATTPLKDYSLYCQSKAALNMQTKALAEKLAPQIRVNAIAPGAIMWPEKNNSLTDITKAAIIEKTLLKRHGHPDYIAQMVLALVENPYITGQIIAVDGGRSVK